MFEPGQRFPKLSVSVGNRTLPRPSGREIFEDSNVSDGIIRRRTNSGTRFFSELDGSMYHHVCSD